MGSKKVYTEQQRCEFVIAVLERGSSLSKEARALGLSRQVAHRWLNRYRQSGMEGLRTRSSRPHRQSKQVPEELLNRLVNLRRRQPTWGPKKLLAHLSSGIKQQPFCSVRTVGRWLKRLNLSRKRRHRAQTGQWVQQDRLSIPSRANEVWTVDFKGLVRTKDGKKWDPLTVRDLYSRMGLIVQLLPNQSAENVQRVMNRLFRRYGLPRVIRVDNGSPFGSRGPLGLTALSLGWRRLGIQVEFTRRASPQDNGAHEQFHRVYKAEVLHRTSAQGTHLQRRTNRWLHSYNYQRPHEALGQKVPALYYRKSWRRYHPLKSNPSYPANWKTVKVTNKGYIRWKQRIRLVSEMVKGQKVGLKSLPSGYCEVYFDRILLGLLHPKDLSGMRPLKLIPRPKP